MLRLRLEGHTYQYIANNTGLTRQRIQQILSPPRAIRDYMIKKYSGLCVDCGILVGKSGHVHHENMDSEEKYDDIDNLVLLCCSCHRTRHRIHHDVNSHTIVARKTTDYRNRIEGAGEQRIDSIKRCVCKRCEYEWWSRIDNPLNCPRCHSPYWNKEERRQ